VVFFESVLVAYVCDVGEYDFFNVFAIGDNSEMGLYDGPSPGSLFGFNMGTILASFQLCGIMFLFKAMLKICV
jgi:hypothetical protein